MAQLRPWALAPVPGRRGERWADWVHRGQNRFDRDHRHGETRTGRTGVKLRGFAFVVDRRCPRLFLTV